MTHDLEQVSRRMFMALSGMATAGVLGAATPVSLQAQPKTAQERKNLDLVLAMAASWKTRDAEKIATYFHEDVYFRGAASNVEDPPTIGKKAFIATIAKFLSTLTKAEMVIPDAFALHAVVIASHLQLLENKERGAHECLDIASFYIQDGLIREWNDYIFIPYAQPRQTGTAERGKFLRMRA